MSYGRPCWRRAHCLHKCTQGRRSPRTPGSCGLSGQPSCRHWQVPSLVQVDSLSHGHEAPHVKRQMVKLSRHLWHGLEVPFSRLFIPRHPSFLRRHHDQDSFNVLWHPWYDSIHSPHPSRRPVYGRMAAPRPHVYYRLIHRLVCYCSLRSPSSLLTLAMPSHHPSHRDQFIIGDNTPPPPPPPPPPLPQSRHLPVRVRTRRRVLVDGRGGSIYNTFNSVGCCYPP
jgi:hypothetical protein